MENIQKLTEEQESLFLANIKANYGHYINNKINRVNGYFAKPLNDEFLSYLIETLINETETQREYFKVLSDYDAYRFARQDRLNSFSDYVEDETTITIIDFIKNGDDNFNNDYYETDYLIEQLLYIFELKNVFDKVNGHELFTESRGDLFMNKAYIESLMDSYTIEDLLNGDYDLGYNQIDLIFCNFLFDNYQDNIKITFNDKWYKELLITARKNAIKELNNRLDNLNTDLTDITEEFIRMGDDYQKAKVLLSIDLKHKEDEMKAIKGALE